MSTLLRGDPRDRRIGPLTISYDLSPSKVFRNLALHLVRRTKRLNFLLLENAFAGDAPMPGLPDLDLPSWVPDWRRPYGSIWDAITSFVWRDLQGPVEDLNDIVSSPGLHIDTYLQSGHVLYAKGCFRLRGVRVATIDNVMLQEHLCERHAYNLAAMPPRTWRMTNLEFDEAFLDIIKSHGFDMAHETETRGASPFYWVTPSTAELGDVIVVVEGSIAALVIRPVGGSPTYKYVGPAKLIPATLEDNMAQEVRLYSALTSILQSGRAESIFKII